MALWAAEEIRPGMIALRIQSGLATSKGVESGGHRVKRKKTRKGSFVSPATQGHAPFVGAGYRRSLLRNRRLERIQGRANAGGHSIVVAAALVPALLKIAHERTLGL